MKRSGEPNAEISEKFQDFNMPRNGRPESPQNAASYVNGANGHWQPQRGNTERALGWAGADDQHENRKSLSDVIRTIRTRPGSVSLNAHEVADALKAPVSPKLIVSSYGPLL